MRSAFTMIELIFVIVLIGILSSVAIPRLTTTRDDAEAAKASEEVRTLISDIAVFYTANGHFDKLSKMTNISLVDATLSPFDANLTTKAFYTGSAKSDKCLGFQVNDMTAELNVTTQSTTSGLCRALNKMVKSSIMVHTYGGGLISYN